VAVRFKAWDCYRSLAGTAGGGGMSVSCDCFVLPGRGTCEGPITHPDESHRVWRAWVWPKNLMVEDWIHYGCRAMRKKYPCLAFIHYYYYYPCLLYVRCFDSQYISILLSAPQQQKNRVRKDLVVKLNWETLPYPITMFPECPLLFSCFDNKVLQTARCKPVFCTFFTPYSIRMRILGVKLFLVNVNQDGMSVFKYVVMVTVVLCTSTWSQNAGAWFSTLTDEQILKAEVLNVRTHHDNHPQSQNLETEQTLTYPCTDFSSMTNTHMSYARGSGYKLGRLLRPRIFCSRSKKSRDYLN
jgi:hypothetical protein